MVKGVETLGGRFAGTVERRTALGAVVVMTAVAVLASVFAGVRLPPVPPFRFVYATLAATADLLTAVLLLSSVRVSYSRAFSGLAAAYVFEGLAIAAQTAVASVVVPHESSRAAESVQAWLWTAWHGVFPLAVVGYAVGVVRTVPRRSSRVPLGVLAAPLVVPAVAVAAVTWGLVAAGPRLPILATVPRAGELAFADVCGAVAAVHAAALVAFVVLTRARSVAHLWTSVAVTASMLDAAISMRSSEAYGVGWFASRGMSLASSFALLIALWVALGVLFARLRRTVSVDVLTGVANRRVFDETLEAQLALAHRTRQPLSVLMIDVDLFKRYNDEYGHQAGDVALREVARTLAEVVGRKSDCTARYGGEEFVAILPSTDAADARRVAERIRSAVRRLGIRHRLSPFDVVTVSVGIGALQRGEGARPLPALDLIARADKALYHAKAAGRNEIAIYDDHPESPP